MGFPGGSDGKASACNAGDAGSIPGSGRSPGEGIGYPLQYFWASLVAQLVKNLQCRRPRFDPWVGKGKATLSSRGFPCGSDSKASAYNAGDPGSIPCLEDPLEKEMATHSSVLACNIPWTEEPSRLQSMGSQRVRHD